MLVDHHRRIRGTWIGGGFRDLTDGNYRKHIHVIAYYTAASCNIEASLDTVLAVRGLRGFGVPVRHKLLAASADTHMRAVWPIELFTLTYSEEIGLSIFLFLSPVFFLFLFLLLLFLLLFLLWGMSPVFTILATS